MINVITRSGGNPVSRLCVLSSSAKRRTRRSSAPRLPYSAVTRELRFNNYGGTFGGPIKQDRAFFFGNYEEYRYITGSPAYYTVPTVQERGSNFNDLGRVVNGACVPYNIYDPATGSTTAQRTAFAGNIIPASWLDQVSINVMNTFILLPNNTVGQYDPCTRVNNYSQIQRSSRMSGLFWDA